MGRIRVREDILERMGVDYRSKRSLPRVEKISPSMTRSESKGGYCRSELDSDEEWTVIEQGPRSEYSGQSDGRNGRKYRDSGAWRNKYAGAGASMVNRDSPRSCKLLYG